MGSTRHSSRLVASCALSLALVSLGASLSAFAQPLSATLLYTRDEAASVDCPDEATFRRALTTRLGRELAPDAAGRVVVAVHISKHEARRTGTIAVQRPGISSTGLRIVEDASATCAELVDQLLVAAGIALSGAPVVAPPSPPPPPRAPAPPPVAPPPATTPSGPWFEAGLATSYHGGESLGWGPAFGAGYRFGHVALGLGIRIELPLDDGAISTQLTVGSASLCYRALDAGALSLDGCGVAELGVIRASTATERDSTIFAAAGARGGLDLALAPWLALRASVAVLGAFTRSTVFISIFEQFTTSAVVLSGLLGVVLAIP